MRAPIAPFEMSAPNNRIPSEPRNYLHVELPLATGVVHVPNLAEHLALLPPHVMDAHHRPGTAGEPVGVTPIQLVLVVKEDAPVERGAGRGVKATSTSTSTSTLGGRRTRGRKPAQQALFSCGPEDATQARPCLNPHRPPSTNPGSPESQWIPASTHQ